MFWLIELAMLLAIGGVSFWLFFAALGMIGTRWRIGRWPRAQGIVLEHRVYSQRRHHRPIVMVEYTVGLRTYRRACQSPIRSGFQVPANARALLAGYPVGSEVWVFVDPQSPRRAYLWLPEISVIVALLVGAALLGLVAVVGFEALVGELLGTL